ncbi:orphan [Acanthamoeba polyphaga mimivirus]|nr:orphan [Mimivirus reunion]UTE96014.1 orphan [Acanthamoeba polyphaga mimivirus]WMV61512.1 orphan [Mimivirus sp.]WMV62489.1 orphan [Acanthamoeba polyphaga mimivirus]WMV63466.1 orphan [Mimivirus sp.]
MIVIWYRCKVCKNIKYQTHYKTNTLYYQCIKCKTVYNRSKTSKSDSNKN